MLVDAIVGKFVTGQYPMLRDVLSKMTQRGFTLESIYAPDRSAGAQLLVNGDFATGDLTGWETGGTGSFPVAYDSNLSEYYVNIPGQDNDSDGSPASFLRQRVLLSYDPNKKLFLQFRARSYESVLSNVTKDIDGRANPWIMYAKTPGASDNVRDLIAQNSGECLVVKNEVDISMPNNEFDVDDLSAWTTNGTVYIDTSAGKLVLNSSDAYAENIIDVSSYNTDSGQITFHYDIGRLAYCRFFISFLDASDNEIESKQISAYQDTIVLPVGTRKIKTRVEYYVYRSEVDYFRYYIGEVDKYAYKINKVSRGLRDTVNPVQPWKLAYSPDPDVEEVWVVLTSSNASYATQEYRNFEMYYVPPKSIDQIDERGWAIFSFRGASDTDWNIPRSSAKNYLRISWDGEPFWTGIGSVDVNYVNFMLGNYVMYENYLMGGTYNGGIDSTNKLYTTSSAGYHYWIYFNSYGFVWFTNVSGTFYSVYAGVFDPFNSAETTITDATVPVGSNIQVGVADASTFLKGQPVFVFASDNHIYHKTRIVDIDYANNKITLESTDNYYHDEYHAGDIIGTWPARGFIGPIKYPAITWDDAAVPWKTTYTSTDSRASVSIKDIWAANAPAISYYGVCGAEDMFFSPLVVAVTYDDSNDSTKDGTAWPGYTKLFFTAKGGSDYDVFYTYPYVDSFATGGDTTQIIDSTQSWATDEHKDRVMIVIAGAGYGTIKKIAGNDATTLTFYSDLPFTPDTSTKYIIVDEAYRLLNEYYIREEVL